ncbi:hypothetical protein [Sphingomonas sp.]|jgi:hypothetical protein|uniref:hypothetical protein n=1 Tax=Sphingomonas sp. TaxID=28214 RepID=UPI002DF586AE|nr:hypothetical protein [Sphingomonas sp.]
MSRPDGLSSPLPLLFRHATPRTNHPPLPGSYDPEQNAWVVDGPEGKTPVITLADADLVEITTKTKVNQEADDEVGSLVELETKTEVLHETDDEDSPPTRGLVEITTKTAAKQEQDDESPPNRHSLELETKTASQKQETDDEIGHIF